MQKGAARLPGGVGVSPTYTSGAWPPSEGAGESHDIAHPRMVEHLKTRGPIRKTCHHAEPWAFGRLKASAS
jgi:hypothetical protein